MFLFGLAGNIIVWMAAFFTPDFLGDATGFAIEWEGKVMMYLSTIPFICGFVMMYPICKLRPLKIKKPEDARDEFMVSYLEHTHRDHTRSIFLLSAMFGATNTILLIFAIIWFR